MARRIKVIRLQKSCLPRRKYLDGRPENCRKCRFWVDRFDDCARYDCLYLLPERRQPPGDGSTLDCAGCPYGRDRPCIGYCIAKLWKEVIEARTPKKEEA